MKRVMLVTGGSRSGKSRYAMEQALAYDQRVFIATAPVCDSEMAERVAAHQEERAGRFTTVEEPIDLAGVFGCLPADCDVVLLDCLTVWAGNLMFEHGENAREFAELDALLELLKDPPVNVILVTNEVGCGIIPEHAMARRFRDLAGTINQRVAEIAGEVVFVVSGIPVKIKPA